MKKSVVIPIIILFFSIINSVGAEQQVSTIDITFGYTKSTKSYRIYESDISVDIPDGISKILSSMTRLLSVSSTANRPPLYFGMFSFSFPLFIASK